MSKQKNLKTYIIEGNCKHFSHMASMAYSMDSESTAMEATKKQLIKHHCSFKEAPERLKFECMRTCGVKLTIRDVTNE